MNRRTFLKRGLVGGVGALAISTPAFANHLAEPTWPITGLRLRCYQYPFGADLPVDGSGKFAFNALRIEPMLTYQRTARKDNPSEHYTTRIEVLHGRLFNGAFRASQPKTGWQDVWHHENVPPHFAGAEWEVVQANLYTDRLGLWQVLCEITGEESGVVLKQVVLLEKVG